MNIVYTNDTTTGSGISGNTHGTVIEKGIVHP